MKITLALCLTITSVAHAQKGQDRAAGIFRPFERRDSGLGASGSGSHIATTASSEFFSYDMTDFPLVSGYSTRSNELYPTSRSDTAQEYPEASTSNMGRTENAANAIVYPRPLNAGFALIVAMLL